MWFSEIAEAELDELRVAERYLTIVRHRHFVPRIIEFATEKQKYARGAAGGYWRHFAQVLDHPREIWAHAFDYQLDDYARDLVLM